VRSTGVQLLGQQGRRSLWLTDDKLPSHMELIRKAAVDSMLDPDTISLARALISSSFDRVWDQRANGGAGGFVPSVPYHGRYYRGALDWRQAAALCGHRDRLCEVTQIWNFIVLNIRYCQDVRQRDTYATLQASLEAGAEDCDGFTVAFAALLGAVGYPVKARVMSIDGRVWDHIYPIVGIKGRWIPLDATELGKQIGWEFPRAARKVDFEMV